MSRAVGVLIVHGCAEPTRIATDFAACIEQRLSWLGVPADRVAWRDMGWSGLLSQDEHRLLSMFEQGTLSPALDARRESLQRIGGMLAYQQSMASRTSLYDAIHAMMLSHLRALHLQLDGRDRPLVVIAHGLGSAIVSDHLWDLQTGRRRADTAFARLETMTGFVTVASVIPLLTMTLQRVEGVVFPSPELPPHLESAVRWLNFYDKADAYGWPLRPLSDSYAAAVHEDRAIDASMSGHSGAQHTREGYWTSAEVVEPTAAIIRRAFEAAKIACESDAAACAERRG